MSSSDWHKIHTDQYEEAEAEAEGAFVGFLAGHGLATPRWTIEFTEAFRTATRVAFDGGFEAAQTAATP